MGRSGRYLWIFLMVSLWALASCGKKGPEPIALGKDNCANCGMIASDAKFGAELITRKGKLYKFDSVECLAGYLNKKGKGEEVGSLWVVDFNHPSTLIDATKAFYLVSERLPSPMGLNLSAFGQREAATGMSGQYSGKVLSWDEVLKYVGQRWN